jgi:glycosyltransferase involved in cell wall biosynthesis
MRRRNAADVAWSGGGAPAGIINARGAVGEAKNGNDLQRPGPPGGEPVSVLVITRDEEANIEACLRCLDFTDDVIVLDSHSTDRTVEIASRFPNVRVFTRPFDTEWKQRNHGLHEMPFRHEWVYVCDADERVPRDLADEILAAANDPAAPHAAYRLRYKNMFMGRWINHASTYPVWIIRLVRPKLVTYEQRETNIHPQVQGTVGELRGHFTHYSFNSGLVRWFQKHNFYSTREAIEGAKVRRQGRPKLAALRDPDPMVRRRTAKNLSYFLPGRGWLRFAYAYFLRGGFRDGAPGLHYCLMTGMYEYWTELKIREIERSEKGRPPLLPAGETADALLARQIRDADARSDEWARSRTGPRLPGGPMATFLRSYVLGLGFLRGRPGWHTARLAAGAHYMAALLYRDKLSRAKGDAASNENRSTRPRADALVTDTR